MCGRFHFFACLVYINSRQPCKAASLSRSHCILLGLPSFILFEKGFWLRDNQTYPTYIYVFSKGVDIG